MLDNNGSIITCYAYEQLTGFLAAQRTGSNRNNSNIVNPNPAKSRFILFDPRSKISAAAKLSYSVQAIRTPALIYFIRTYHDCYNI